MTTRAQFIDYVCEQAGLEGRLSSRRMFGDYAIYLDGKVVALACGSCCSRLSAPDASVAGRGH